MNHTLPPDHDARMARARLSLEGLSIGDAFGQRFFFPQFNENLRLRTLPPPTWYWTDDTAMALSIVDEIDDNGTIDQESLATRFGKRFQQDSARGYGGMAVRILESIAAGKHWSEVSPKVFDGSGSMGNGGAMRIAPLGAYFANDLKRCADEAMRSAEVTHAHPEGQAGSVAVAVAASVVASMREQPTFEVGQELFKQVLALTPDGMTRSEILMAATLPLDENPLDAARQLGNGSRVIAPDTVPFCLWSAARHLNSFEEAMWTTISVGGDMDTNAAIVGGIVALYVGENAIPDQWKKHRELLPLRLEND